MYRYGVIGQHEWNKSSNEVVPCPSMQAAEDYIRGIDTECVIVEVVAVMNRHLSLDKPVWDSAAPAPKPLAFGDKVHVGISCSKTDFDTTNALFIRELPENKIAIAIAGWANLVEFPADQVWPI